MTTQEISAQALKLPARDRAELIEQLLVSLDDLPVPEVEQIWFAEAARRAAEIDDGTVRCLPAAQVHAEAQALLR